MIVMFHPPLKIVPGRIIAVKLPSAVSQSLQSSEVMSVLPHPFPGPELERELSVVLLMLVRVCEVVRVDVAAAADHDDDDEEDVLHLYWLFHFGCVDLVQTQ